jgi:hypothetical protein
MLAQDRLVKLITGSAMEAGDCMNARIAVFATLAVCLAGTLGLSTAAPVPKEKAVLYHPTRVGSQWVYKSGDRESVEAVSAAEEKDGVWLVTVGRMRRGQVEPAHVVSVSAKGLAIVAGFPVGDLTEPAWLLKLPQTEGNKWEVVLAAEQWGRAIGSAKAFGPEKVEVPAGTFKAIRVEFELPYIDGREGKAKKTIWYAPEVGKVKEVYGETVELLKSFDRGKE